jgi:hypothetical protein
LPGIIALSAAGLLVSLSVLAAQRPDTAVVPSTWQPQHGQFFFNGYTTRYTCDALQGEVRRILIFLGARADARVKADCPRGPYVPAHTAWVTVDFSTLAPTHGTGPTVEGHWVRTELAPRHPIFMQEGDCFLIEDMKPLLTSSFATRGVLFHSECMPYAELLDSYGLEGEVLAPQHPQVPQPELGNNSGRDNS